MPTIIDSLLVTLGLDPSSMKKGAAEADKVQKKLEDDTKKSNKRMSDEERKRFEEQRRQNKVTEERTKAVAAAIRQVRNETLGLLGLFMGGMGIKNFVANTIDQASSLKFLSENLDMSVESIQAYQRASERMGGSAAGMVAQLQESQSEIAKLRTGQGPSAAMQATFRAAGMAGISLNEADLKNGNDYLMARSKILAVLYKQNAGNAQIMAAQMGISQDQFNLIKMGPEALQKLAAAQLKNSVISARDAEQALRLKNRWLDFTDSAQATGTKILVSLIPAFKEVLGWLQKVTNWIAAHRDDIANWINAIVPKILDAAEAFGRFVKNMDWKGVIEDAKALLDVVVGIARAIDWLANFIMPKEEDKSAFEKGADKAVSKMWQFLFPSEDNKFGFEKKADKFLSGLLRGSPSGVGAPNVAPGGGSTHTTDVKIGQLSVHTQATDAAGIAKALPGALSRYGFVAQANTGMR